MEPMKPAERKRTVRTFALASFLNDMGSDMIYPIWPLFVTSFLGADMAVLGFIDGLGDALVSVSQAASGYASDRLGRRKVFVWTGYLFGSASRVGYALSTAWQHLIPFRILDRVGKMRGAPRDAMIADASDRKNRGSTFGVLRTMDNLGAICGIILCIALFGTFGYANLFALAAIPSTIGAVMVLLVIKEKRTPGRIYRGLSLKRMGRNLKLFLAISAIFALGSFSYSFLLIFAKQAGFDVAFVPVLYLVFTAVAFAFSLPFGKLADRIGRKRVLMISYAFWALLCLISLLTQSYAAVFAIFLLYGLHKGALEPSQKALVSELAPAESRASALGAFQMAVGICALPASMLAGLLWDWTGMATPFYLSLALTAVSMTMLAFVKE